MQFPVFYPGDYFFAGELQSVEKEYQRDSQGANCVEGHWAVVAARLRKQIRKSYHDYDCEYEAVDLKFQRFSLTPARYKPIPELITPKPCRPSLNNVN